MFETDNKKIQVAQPQDNIWKGNQNWQQHLDQLLQSLLDTDTEATSFWSATI